MPTPVVGYNSVCNYSSLLAGKKLPERFFSIGTQ